MKRIINIEIFDLGTSRHEYIKHLIANDLRKVGIKPVFIDKTDVDEFVRNRLYSIPAAKVKDKIFFKDDYGDLFQFVHAVSQYCEKKSTFIQA